MFAFTQEKNILVRLKPKRSWQRPPPRDAAHRIVTAALQKAR
jgi:hypothetical protein